MPTIEQTKAFVSQRHAGQEYRPGEPYTGHLYRVHDHLRRLFPDASEAVQHAALLHDVLEDTDTTEDELRALGYDDETIEIVRLVTKDPSDGFGYQERIEKVIIGSGNLGAMRVKRADNEDNGDPSLMVHMPPERQKSMMRKYMRARLALDEAIALIEQVHATPP